MGRGHHHSRMTASERQQLVWWKKREQAYRRLIRGFQRLAFVAERMAAHEDAIFMKRLFGQETQEK